MRETNPGNKEVTASQLLDQGKPGQTYELAGTVVTGSVQHQGATLLFRIRDPKREVSVPVRYTGVVPDPFAAGRAVMVAVKREGANYVGQQNSLTTKCPSKYQAAAARYFDGHFVVSESCSPMKPGPRRSTVTRTARPAANGSGTMPV